jgi:hypothetical protein
MITDAFKAAIRTEIEHVKTDGFTKDYQASDEEALGIVLAQFFEWDGVAVLKTASYALEDANFHTESAVLDDLAAKAEGSG